MSKEKIIKHCIGLSADHRTNKWELVCPKCSKRWAPTTTVFAKQSVVCPKCGYREEVNYNEADEA